MKLLFLLLFFSAPLEGICQIVNSNQNVIGEFYDGKVKAIEINGAKVTSQFRIKTFEKIWNYTQHANNISAKKNNTFFLSGGLTNTNSNLFNLNKFDFKKNNGFTVGMVFQHSFSEVYLAPNAIRANTNPRFLQSYLVSVDYKRDKFLNYDPEEQLVSTATPAVVSLRGAYSLYFFNYKDAAKNKYTLIPTVSGKVNFKDYNSGKLLNYIKTTNTQQQDSIIYTSSSTYDGKYGVVDNSLKTAQLAFSIPIVPPKFSRRFPILSPIPYFAYDFYENDKPRLNGGIAIGILSSPLLDNDETTTANGTYRKFNVPSYLTVGVDWNYKDGKGSKPNFYVSGSIKLQ